MKRRERSETVTGSEATSSSQDGKREQAQTPNAPDKVFANPATLGAAAAIAVTVGERSALEMGPSGKDAAMALLNRYMLPRADGKGEQPFWTLLDEGEDGAERTTGQCPAEMEYLALLDAAGLFSLVFKMAMQEFAVGGKVAYGEQFRILLEEGGPIWKMAERMLAYREKHPAHDMPKGDPLEEFCHLFFYTRAAMTCGAKNPYQGMALVSYCAEISSLADAEMARFLDGRKKDATLKKVRGSKREHAKWRREKKIERMAARKVEIARCIVGEGKTAEETARELGLSDRTVRRIYKKFQAEVKTMKGKKVEPLKRGRRKDLMGGGKRATAKESERAFDRSAFNRWREEDDGGEGRE